MAILFIGGIFTKEAKIKTNSIGNIQYAADNFQKEIIKGLDYWNGKPIDILNAVFVGSWPLFYKKKKIEEYEFRHCDEKEKTDINISFLNIKYIKQVSRALNIKKKLNEWLKKNNEKQNIIYIYSYHFPFLYAINNIKKKYKNTKICLIVPDLPEYMNLSKKKSFLYTVLKKIEILISKYYIKDIDSYIFLTEHMKEKIKIGNKPYEVVEGIAPSIKNEEKNETKQKEKFKILYSGTLEEKYGIMTLIEMMQYINDKNVELIICGEGECKQEIIKASIFDKRIKYLGILEPQKVRELQRKASLLVNPRKDNEEYTKYSFPSKTLEYLMSGTPILMNKLRGISKEYNEYIFFLENGLPKEWGKKIEEIIKRDDLDEIGKKAFEFVIKNKNFKVQSEKIYKIMKNYY